MDLLPVILLFLSIVLTTFNRGFFSLPGFTVLLSLFGLLFYLFFREKAIFSRQNSSFLSYILISVFTLSLFYHGGIYQSEIVPSIILTVFGLLIFPLILTYIIPPEKLPPKTLILRFYFLLLAAIISRFLLIIASPKPIIDVFTLLKEAPIFLLSGKNPYAAVFSPVYSGILTNYYPYWPVSFLLEIPLVKFLPDPRVLLILAEIAGAYLLYRLGKKTFPAEIFALIYLFRPNANFMIEQSWLTPLIFFFLVLTVFLLEKKKWFLTGVALGLTAGLQPLYFSLLPFFLFWRKKAAIFFGALLIFLVTTVPFLFWDFSQFVQKTILVYFKPLNEIPTVPVHLSLNLNTAYYLFSGRDLPVFIPGLLFTGLTVFIFFRIFARSKFEDENSFNAFLLLGLALFFSGFYLFFRQAFINYYYFVTDLIILWLVVATRFKTLEK